MEPFQLARLPSEQNDTGLELDLQSILQLTMLFVLEWSQELDYQFSYKLPMPWSFG